MLQRSYHMTSPPPVVMSQEGSMKQDWGQHRVIGSKGCKPYEIAPWKGELKLAVSYSLGFHSS